MEFQVGDQVVHWAYGPGEVVQLDEKVLSGRTNYYYVVKIGSMTIWVPTENEGTSSLRLPTPASEFAKLFSILNSPGEPLSADRFERKTQLLEQMRDGTLQSMCLVIRDLYNYSRTKKLNDVDSSLLERAQNFLLNEWKVSLSIPIAQAEQELRQLLGSSHHSTVPSA